MFRGVISSIERAVDSVEMLFVAIRRSLVGDVGYVLRGFDKITAELDAFAARENAAQQREYAKLSAIYDRIEARREAIGRAHAVAQNIKNLTTVQ